MYYLSGHGYPWILDCVDRNELYKLWAKASRRRLYGAPVKSSSRDFEDIGFRHVAYGSGCACGATRI